MLGSTGVGRSQPEEVPVTSGTPGFDAKALADIRRTRSMTQAQLADMVGITRTRLSDYERGAIVPAPRTCQRLARALSVPTGALITTTEPTPDLARLRAQAGMTQKEVGDAIGISSVAVSQIETARQRLTERRTRQLAALYDVDNAAITAAAETTARHAKESR